MNDVEQQLKGEGNAVHGQYIVYIYQYKSHIRISLLFNTNRRSPDLSFY